MHGQGRHSSVLREDEGSSPCVNNACVWQCCNWVKCDQIPVSRHRHVREGTAGDEEAEGGGGQAEGRDPGKRPRADAKERGCRGCKTSISSPPHK